MNVINKWSDVSILKYQQLLETLKLETQYTLDKEIILLELFSEYNRDEISKLPYYKFQELLRELNFLSYPLEAAEIKKEIVVKDKKFKIKLDVESMTTEEYIDLTELTKNRDEIMNNMHLIIASVCKCDGFDNIKQKAEWIQENMDIVTGNSIMVFFCTYLTNYMTNFLENQKSIMKIRMMFMSKKKKQKMKDFLEYLETYISWIAYQNLEDNLGTKQ